MLHFKTVLMEGFETQEMSGLRENALFLAHVSGDHDFEKLLKS